MTFTFLPDVVQPQTSSSTLCRARRERGEPTFTLHWMLGTVLNTL